ncbi:reverse transcriptase domain-containing protein, partial [Tanacetum coccineum]
ATHGVGRTTVATGTLKAATKVPDQEQRSPPLGDVITKGHPREERRSCQKAKVASEVIGSQKVWFDDLPKETIDSYDDLKKAFLENYLQQKKCIKDPVKIHNIRQRDGESTEEFVRRYKLECKDEANQKQNFKKGGFQNQQRSKRKQDRFALLTKTPKEIFALDKGKFKAPPPMTTPVEKRNANKFCKFHEEVGHNTDECMHLRKQIEEMLKAGKLSHFVKEIKQNNRKEQSKVTKKGETARKDKAVAILMVHPWERVARQRIMQSFSPNSEISFPPLGEDEGTEGLMIIEAEIGGHCVHRMYVDGESASEILHEHCFSRLRPEIKIQLIPSTAPLIGFSVVRSPSLYNGIIGRLGVRKLHAVVDGGVITLKSSRLVPLECAMVFGSERNLPASKSTVEERIKVATNPEYPEQTILIGSTLTEEGRNKLCSML